ncbi:MAG: shikimate kinase [Acidobacteriota bacterium]|jgi:shikimate kinase|nr:shikimate kinase [Acidobacteriota bacterium]
MEECKKRIVLTGFMGVGKSTVARHLSYITKNKKIDLDDFIEQKEKRRIPEIIETDGLDIFRQVETKRLKQILAETDASVISLGGGAWTTAENREIIKSCKCVSVWLESTFDHCWRNIRFSKRTRPLVKNKKSAKKLFEERKNHYCLADWHFVINPGHNSFEVAKQIAQEIFLAEIN